MQNLTVAEAFGCKPKIPSDSLLAKALVGFIPAKETEYKTATNVGIEVEVENLNKPFNLKVWNKVEDHSLRNNGFEYVSLPLRNQYIIGALSEIHQGLFAHNPDLEFSHRCSMHVHINVSKLTVGQLYALIATYIATEDLFFSLVRKDRQGNSYCWPLADGFLNHTDIKPDNINTSFKYAALNPHHLLDYGTLEFRHHGGTKNTKDILSWVETILQLYKYVDLHNPEKIKATLNNLNSISNYFEFCQEVFGPKFDQFAGLPLHRYMRDNVTAAKVFIN